MSVLIEGMEMPTRCFSCPMCDVKNAEVNCAISHGSYIEYRDVDPQIAMRARPDWCPLIEVPPHGRLIDADALNRRLNWERDLAVAFGGEVAKAVADMCDLMIRETEMMPTVIPADKDGET